MARTPEGEYRPFHDGSAPEKGLGQGSEVGLPAKRWWTSKLLPNTVVVAVDERDPASLEEKRSMPEPYPFDERLLNDHRYIRARRLEMEHFFSSSQAFGDALIESLNIIHRDIDSGEITPNQRLGLDLRRLSAILNDWKQDPDAAVESQN